eukprot:TRINITY_DN690_c0_g1_i1.p1 TRINITY_DN690_c0_g1~~TRINITY_DN690_c0_g1_i1.p1  ORF type:complete len:206 (-),score=58.75 TRINITY_DN690_c0_g1_i1:46-642(-)
MRSLVAQRNKKQQEQQEEKEKVKSNKNSTSEEMARDIILQKHWNEFEEVPGIVVEFPNPKDLTKFTLYASPYQGFWKGASFMFNVEIPVGYPNDAPKVSLETVPIYHPNINYEGKICLNILREDWSPLLGIQNLVFGIITLFEAPNPYDPLPNALQDKELEAHSMMLKNPEKFKELVTRTLNGGHIQELNKTFPRLIF